MHRFRSWTLDPPEWRTQRNRSLPIEGGDGSTLSLDFTTGVLDPRLTFTRGSNATFINSGGLVEWAAANMMTYSQSQDSNTFWNAFGTSVTRTASQSDPLGGTGAVKLDYDATSSDAVISRTVTVSQGLTYTLSVWLRADSGTVNNLRLGRGASAAGSYFPSLTTAWQRFSLTFVATGGSDGIELRVLTSGSPKTASFHVFGAQLEPGDTMRGYNPALAAVPYHAPRFDHDPTTPFAPKGLLIEGTATNRLPNSQTLSGTGWGTGGICTTTTNYTTGPDGVANSATRLEMSFSGGTGRTYYDTGYTTLPHTNSVWLKSNTGSNQTVNLWNTSGTPVSCTVTPTWQRFQSVSTTGSSLPGYFYLENPSTTVAVDILAWGAQLEAGSGVSSYIPTGASTVQRLADSAVMNDIAPLNYSATNGSIYWSGIINKQPTSYITLVGFMTAIDQPAYDTFGNALNYFTAARGPSLNTGGSNEVSRTYVLGSLIKYASSVNTLQDPIVAVNLNGSASSTNKSGTGDLRVATRFVIGRQPSSTYGANYPSVTIRSIKYWPTTKTAAELAVLTA